MTSILVLGLTCLMASLTSMDTMSPILVVLLLLNTASAVQDICVDSLAIEILEPGELGAGNMIQASLHITINVWVNPLHFCRLLPTRLGQCSQELRSCG